MAPSKSNLVKAAHEGFAMLDEFFERKKGKAPSQPPLPIPKQHDRYMNMYQRQPQKPHVYQVLVPVPEAKVATATATIDCYEAARIFNGTVIVDYPNTKKLPVRRYA
ncbi:hypothetical protein POM88_015718 [Heracleum sosnowskyi]|uniref:Uncharacterized protein n=1 Tax=Heracleum sosnowskyi TaxID=360622 RepID=A0AAD8MSB5_9APIA|nr:hypothetical protein POM88_015718 [Heracleum sosnowskyi]